MQEHRGNDKILLAFRFLSFFGQEKKIKTAGDVADSPNVPTALRSFRLLKMAGKINSRMKSVFYPHLALPSSFSSPVPPPPLSQLHPKLCLAAIWMIGIKERLRRCQDSSCWPTVTSNLKQTTCRTARLFYLFLVAV